MKAIQASTNQLSPRYFALVCIGSSTVATMASVVAGMSPAVYAVWTPLTLLIGGILMLVSKIRDRRRAAKSHMAWRRDVVSHIPGAIPLNASHADDNGFLGISTAMDSSSLWDEGAGHSPDMGFLDNSWISDDPYRNAVDNGVNPSTGLPMFGGIDTGGNIYGCGDSDSVSFNHGSTIDDW